jgi:chitin disaccharide deacetylase
MYNYCLILLFAFCSLMAAGQKKSIQERLGYPKGARLLILHADDAGVSHSENAATISAMEKGCINSASIMVPCPWFPEIALYAHQHLNMDFGLHITLTSEWKLYKWGTVTQSQLVPTLLNNNNFLYSTVDSVVKNASSADVETEIRNQVKRARQFGIDPTHLDSHMFSAFRRLDYLKAYIKIGHEYKIPVFIPHELETSLGVKLDSILTDNDVVVDTVVTAMPDNFKAGMHDFYINSLKNIKPGLTYFIIHTAFDNDEMRAVTKEFTDWGSAWRQQEYDFFSSPECEKVLKENNIYVITWKEIRDKITRK